MILYFTFSVTHWRHSRPYDVIIKKTLNDFVSLFRLDVGLIEKIFQIFLNKKKKTFSSFITKTSALKTNYLLNFNNFSTTRPILGLNMSLVRADQDLKLCLNLLSSIILNDFTIICIYELLYILYSLLPKLAYVKVWNIY